MAHLVYPGAVHSRFEHSLGVYWLAGEAVQKLKNYQVQNCFFYCNSHLLTRNLEEFVDSMYVSLSLLQGLELDIDRFDIQTVKLAGNELCFSHVAYILCQLLFTFIYFVGLLHDVGHGPFSHLFEREFLPWVLDGHWYVN